VTCMDPRVRVDDFGPAFRDAFVFRNAGGRVTWDTLRSVLVAWRALGVTELVVVHHTECRMNQLTDDQLRQATGIGTGANMDFLTFTDLERSVLDDLSLLQRSAYIANAVPVSGFVWDLRRAELRAVAVDERSRFATAPRGAGSKVERVGRPSTTPASGRATISVPTGGIWRLGRR